MMNKTGRMLTFFRGYWPLVLGAGFIGAGTVLSNVGLLGVSAVLISQAALLPPILDLMVLIVAVRFFGIARALLRYLERYVTHDLTLKILTKLRVRLYQGIEPLAPRGLANVADSALLARLTDDIEVLKFFYLKAVAAPLTALLVVVINGVLLWFFSPWAAVAFVLLALLAGAVIPLAVEKKSAPWVKRYGEAKEGYQNALFDYLTGIGPLLAAGEVENRRQDLARQAQTVNDSWRQIKKLEKISAAGLNFLSHGALWLALVVSIPLVSAGRLSGVYLAMVALMVWAGFEAVLPLAQARVEMRRANEAAEHIFALIDEGANCAAEPQPEVALANYDLCLEQVSFGYRQGQKVLQEITLQIAQGQKVAIVGPSGSGKSSLVNLLVKFYPPDSGKITLGGIDLAAIAEEQLRQVVAVLDQDSYLFNTTIAENLRMAQVAATDAQLWQALAKAGLAEFVQTLPQGLQTVVGQNGLKFSGGQRQRLALARIYLQDSPVIILDEAAQGLDNLTADEIMAQMQTHWQEKTVLVITHRLRQMAQYDSIAVLQEGRLAEMGSHEQLLARQGLYAAMWNIACEEIQ